MSPHLILRPADVPRERLGKLSERIIQELMQTEEMDVVGLSSACFLACSAVNISSRIANIHVTRSLIDYISVPVMGKLESVFFTISRKPGPDYVAEMQKLDKDLNLPVGPDSDVVAVGSRDAPERMTTLALWKLARVKRVKIVAAGAAINNAITTALQLTQGGISKEPVGVLLVGLSSIPSRDSGGVPRQVTAINIYLEKGFATKYDQRHSRILKDLQTGPA